MNNRYVIVVEHPLLRPGLLIETEASERYVVPVARKLMDMVRELNAPTTDAAETPAEPPGVSEDVLFDLRFIVARNPPPDGASKYEVTLQITTPDAAAILRALGERP